MYTCGTLSTWVTVHFIKTHKYLALLLFLLFLLSLAVRICLMPIIKVAFFILQIRNQLNQEQTSKLQQQKELLNKRNMEVAVMDKRINELRERLYGKKIQACEKENICVR